MTKRWQYLGIFLPVLFLTLFFSLRFVVHEGERGLLLWHGKMQPGVFSGDSALLQPGLHFRIPLVEQHVRIDMRNKIISEREFPVLSRDGKSVGVDYYVIWRIKDPFQYYERLRNQYLETTQLIREEVTDQLVTMVASYDRIDLVRNRHSVLAEQLLKRVNEKVESYGMVASGFGIVEMHYPEEAGQAIYAQMNQAQRNLAEQLRLEEQSQLSRKEQQAWLRTREITNQAEQQIIRLNTETTAEIAQLYTSLWRQQPEFFQFILAMQQEKRLLGNRSAAVTAQPATVSAPRHSEKMPVQSKILPVSESITFQ